MRFHSLTANTEQVPSDARIQQPPIRCAPSLTPADDSLPFGDETVTACDDETGVKCYSCGGYFPESSCIANTLDEGDRSGLRDLRRGARGLVQPSG